jgi:hypothetical protein
MGGGEQEILGDMSTSKDNGILTEIERLRRGVFGQQKQLKAFFDLVETHVGTPFECPECKRRREQTRLRVAKVRKKATSPKNPVRAKPLRVGAA